MRKWRLMFFLASASLVFVWFAYQKTVTFGQVFLAIFLFLALVWGFLIASSRFTIAEKIAQSKRRVKAQQKNKEKLERAIAKYALIHEDPKLKLVYEKLLTDTVNQILNSASTAKDQEENEKLVDSILQEKIGLIEKHKQDKKEKIVTQTELD